MLTIKQIMKAQRTLNQYGYDTCCERHERPYSSSHAQTPDKNATTVRLLLMEDLQTGENRYIPVDEKNRRL